MGTILKGSSLLLEQSLKKTLYMAYVKQHNKLAGGEEGSEGMEDMPPMEEDMEYQYDEQEEPETNVISSTLIPMHKTGNKFASTAAPGIAAAIKDYLEGIDITINFGGGSVIGTPPNPAGVPTPAPASGKLPPSKVKIL
jgi:hypothetical protein